MYLLQDVVLNGALELLGVGALTTGDQYVERQQNGGCRIDGHGRSDLIERDVIEQQFHVGDGSDGDAHLSHFAGGERMVGVHAHLRGQIEGDGESGGALRQQVAVALVAFLGGAEAGVLAHGPQPLAVHVFIDTPGVWKLTWLLVSHERVIFRALRKEVTPK